MSKEKWSDAKTKGFISSYIKQTSLWNVSDPDYSIKSKKEKGYNCLQEEFGLSLNEVKNKIRIYRTTYGQELKKMETTNAPPKLTWFHQLHKAFNQGKIKSFTKTPTKIAKPEPSNKKMIEIEFQEGTSWSEEEVEKIDGQDHFDLKKIGKQEKEAHETIIEQYEVDYEEEEAAEYHTMKNDDESRPNCKVNSSPASPGNGMLSNELFLKSLQATLDRLPDAKNMRARIRIQEVLYKIAYELD